MLLLALGARVTGVFMLIIGIMMAHASHNMSAIPGQTVPMWLSALVAAFAILMGVEFMLKCPVLNRIANSTR